MTDYMPAEEVGVGHVIYRLGKAYKITSVSPYSGSLYLYPRHANVRIAYAAGEEWSIALIPGQKLPVLSANEPLEGNNA